MKKAIFIVAILGIMGGLAFHYFAPIDDNSKFSITSPLPDLLTKAFPQALGSEPIWKPNNSFVISNIKKPNINSASIVSYDLTEDKYLFAEGVDTKLPIASLTKIMTAIVAIENMKLNQMIKIQSKAAQIGEDSMGLSENEELPLKELLYGLMLKSGNDAAEAIAAASPFGRDNFVYLMNKKAEELGLTNTHFTNPTGLQGDGKQYSTAADLLVMTRYLLDKPLLAQIVSTYEHDIDSTDIHKDYILYNETNLLTTYPGVKGVKTGYTDEAGMCLVTFLDYNGHKIIGVLLNAENRREGMKELLDYSLKSLGVNPPPHS